MDIAVNSLFLHYEKAKLYHFKVKEYLNSDLPYVMMEEIREIVSMHVDDFTQEKAKDLKR